MAQMYAKDQPEGYINHIRNIAIVGVSPAITLLASR
jgi:hypothetical protein